MPHSFERVEVEAGVLTGVGAQARRGDGGHYLVQRSVDGPVGWPDELAEERHGPVRDVLLDGIVAPAVPAPHRQPPGISCALERDVRRGDAGRRA